MPPNPCKGIQNPLRERSKLLLMNDTDSQRGSVDDRERLKALRAKARKARSRHPLAQGGRGSRKPAPGKSTIDPLASQNSHQKGLTDAATVGDGTNSTVTVVSLHTDIPVAPVVPHDTPAHWRAIGDVEVVVYARPLNPRLLLVQFDDGSHGRVVMSPREREVFTVKKRLWVRPLQKDVYMLAGRYNRFGVRYA
jgi:hypothetical protein